MCLIHNIDETTRISTGWLRNIYLKNSDGIGAMLWEDGKLVVKKTVPKNFRKALRWFRREVEGRKGVVHWRFATHGDVNLDNAHPYPVLTKEEDGIDMWMMHNGVMSQFEAGTELRDVYDKPFRGTGSMYGGWAKYGMLGDATGKRYEIDDRSDTYHMIRVLIRPLVSPKLGGHPDNVRNPAVQALLNEYCGNSNKLVFADSEGNFTYINGHVFVKWEVYGLYCSNTYAWASSLGHLEDPSDRLTKADLAGGDPRKAGTKSESTAVTQYRRFYENDVEDVDLLAWDGSALGQAGNDADDGATEADDKRVAEIEDAADDAWDGLNTELPAAARELAVADIYDYMFKEGKVKYAMLHAMAVAGTMTDMEFVDHILGALAA